MARKTHNADRRRLLQSAASASAVTLIPLTNTSCSSSPSVQPEFSSPFSPDTDATLAAFVARIIPADSNGPGALEADVPAYIHRALGEWRRSDIQPLTAALKQLDRAARHRHNQAFAVLEAAQQDLLMEAMEDGQLDEVDNSRTMFSMLRRLAVEGMFSDPYYGGNQGFIGWDLIGYPGAVMASPPELQRMGSRLPPLHVSAYGADYDGD